MKKLVSVLICIAMVTTIVACSNEPVQTNTDSTTASTSITNLYKAGTYTSSTDGMNGPVSVEVKFSDDAIQSVIVIEHKETAGISDAALTQIPANIVNGQTLMVDAVSGATYTSNAIIEAVTDCVVQAGGSVEALQFASNKGYSKAMSPGVYNATSHGHHSEIKVEVNLTTDAIQSIKVVDEGETYNLADPALKNIPVRIIETQSIGIDVITGATYTSRAILNAVGDCIKQAGGDEALAAFSTRIPSEPWSTEEKTVDTDVVVVGSGLAGISAALSAQGAGANVVLLEKLPYFGGTSQTAAGGFSYNEDPELMYDYMMQKYTGILQGDTYMGGEFPKPSLVRVLAEQSASTIQWLADKGAGFYYINNLVSNYYGNKKADGTVEDSLYWHQYAIFNPGGAQAPDTGGIIFEKLIKEFLDNGGKLYLETAAVSLITDSSGAVKGVKASGKDGKYTFNAKAVVLCAGGFGASEEMIEKYAPAYIGEVNVTLNSNTGDGIRMAADIGAAVYESGFMMGGSGHSLMTDKNMISPYGDAETPKTALYVSPNGLRLNSEAPESYTNSMLHVNPDSRDYYWVIINEKNAATSEEYMDILKENLADGNERFFKENTLTELANTIRIPHNALAYTMNRYNELCKDGEDKDLFKNPAFLVAMEEGPWYAVKAYMVYFGTVGGVVTDETAAVLNEKGERIPGLFAAGENANLGLFNLSYTGGYALTDCAVFGRVAGASAAEYVAK